MTQHPTDEAKKRALADLSKCFLTIIEPSPESFVVPTPLTYEAISALEKHWPTIEAALTDAVVIDAPEGQIIATIENEIFDYCTAHHVEGWDHKSLAKHLSPLIAAYAQGRTQAVPDGSAPERYWLIEQPDLEDDDDYKRIHTTDLDVYPNAKVLGEYVLKQASLDTVPDGWKLVPIEPNADMVFFGSDVSSVNRAQCEVVYKAMLSAAPPVTGGAWLPIESVPEGEHILLYFPEGEKGVPAVETAMVFRGGTPHYQYGFSFWTHGGPNGGIDFDVPCAPTMWRHIEYPAPPSSAEKEGV